MALYSSSVFGLLVCDDQEIDVFVTGLLSKPKIKITYAMGKTIKAIIDHGQSGLNIGLNDLLNAHRGKAKFGGLRESPEGYLCLPAMSLSKIALERGMDINTDSEYLSMGYLKHLSRNRPESLLLKLIDSLTSMKA